MLPLSGAKSEQGIMTVRFRLRIGDVQPHTHVYRLPGQDGETPLTETVIGICECGQTTTCRALWLGEDEAKLKWCGPNVPEEELS